MRQDPSPYSAITFRQDKRAWLIFGIFLIISIWGARKWTQPEQVFLEPWQNVATLKPKITILHFGNIVEDIDSEFLNVKKLEKQLRALKESGFTAVSLSDLWNFYYDKKPLPAKTLVLMFDHGFLETYLNVDPVLRKLKWPAIISINTHYLENRETFFLYWDRLGRMVSSGLWDIASSGHQPAKSVLIDPKGREGKYLTHRIWLLRENRLENILEYSNRIKEDYRLSKSLIEKNIEDYKVLAYSPVFKYQENITHDRSLDAIHHQVLRENYSLGFTDSFIGVNDETADPHRLRRLKVDPEWEPEKLRKLVLKALRAPTLTHPAESSFTTSWFDAKGNLIETGASQGETGKTKLVSQTHSDSQKIILGPTLNGVWIPGGPGSDQWRLTTEIEINHGEFWVLQKDVSGTAEWRLGGKSPSLRLQYREAEGPFYNLAVSKDAIGHGAWHHLLLIKRGRGIWAELDRKPLWKRPVKLSGIYQGDIGLTAWAGDGKASIGISQASFSRLPLDLRWLKSYPSAGDAQFLIKRSKRISALTVSTYIIQENHLEPTQYDQDLFKILVNRFGWDFIPTFQLKGMFESRLDENQTDLKFSSPVWASKVLDLVHQEKWKTIHFDLSSLSPMDRRGFKSWVPVLEKALLEKGCRLLITEAGRPGLDQPMYFESSLNPITSQNVQRSKSISKDKKKRVENSL